MQLHEFKYKRFSREHYIAQELLLGNGRSAATKQLFKKVGHQEPFIYRENTSVGRIPKPLGSQYRLFLYNVNKVAAEMKAAGWNDPDSPSERMKWTSKDRAWVKWRKEFIDDLIDNDKDFDNPDYMVHSPDNRPTFVPVAKINLERKERKFDDLREGDVDEIIEEIKIPDDVYDERGRLVTEYRENSSPARYEIIHHTVVYDRDEVIDHFYSRMMKARAFVLQRELCVGADTLILTTDFKWVKAESINAGDELVGFKEYPIPGRGQSRTLCPATVIENKEQIFPCYEIMTDQDTKTVVSEGHRWLVLHNKKPEWVETQNLKIGDKILWFGEPWGETINQRASDYLAGLYDGEGYIDSDRIHFAQNKGLVLDYAIELLENLDFSIGSKAVDKQKRQGLCVDVYLNGGIAEWMRFMDWVQPVRFVDKSEHLWIGRSIVSKGPNVSKVNYAKVLDIRFVGKRKTYSVTTTTSTFIADGLLSHNSGQHLDFISTRALKDGCKAITYGISIDEVMEAVIKTWPTETRNELNNWTVEWKTTSLNVIQWPKYENPLPGSHRFLGYVICLAKARIPIFLVGPSGCGKSFLARDLADALDMEYGELPLTAGATPSWLVGAETITGYKSRPFIEIYKNGGVFCFEEMDAADPNMLLLVNNALANEFLTNPVTGMEVPKHEDFIPVATANTWGLGANRQFTGRERLDAATLDRWRVGRVEMDYDMAIEKQIVNHWKIESEKHKPRVKKAVKS